ncbi:MAG: metal ABC transporter permease [Candidatus Micrarchaeota archaeon]|nr:metal ABC transporter permease [Candidatus Micrarchaeota archaeon]
MLDIFQYAFMQKAFAGGILAALLCSTIGVFLVLRRMALFGDGLAHISFGGVAAGLLLKIYPLASALAFSVIAAISIQKLKQMKIRGDSAIAVLFSFGLALGVVLASASGGFGADLMPYLFGSILAISDADLLAIILIGGTTLAALASFYRQLLYASFDEESARASGIPVERLNALLLVLAAITVVLSMKVVGILLVSSFIAIPATIAIRLSKSFTQALAASAIVASASVAAGLLAAYYFGVSAGGAIVMALALAFAASLLAGKEGNP